MSVLMNSALIAALSFAHFQAVQAPANQLAASGHVNIAGGLSASQVREGDSILFWVTVDNETDSDLSDLTVQLEVKKSAFTASCIPASSGNSEVCGPLPNHVLPGQSVTLRGRLRCLDSTEPNNINAVVSFDSLSPTHGASTSSVRVVSLGPLVGLSLWLALFATYKDLVLPFVVAVVGWYITSQQAKHQTERAQIGETWNSMLPISHRLAMRYYMPMVKALMRVSEDISKSKQKPGSVWVTPTEEGLSIYFHLMLFWWRFKITQDKQGAIYFKNRTGEKILLVAFREFRKTYKGEGEERFAVERRVKAIQNVFTSALEFPDFIAIFNAQTVCELKAAELKAAFNTGWSDFQKWYSDVEKRERGLAAQRFSSDTKF